MSLGGFEQIAACAGVVRDITYGAYDNAEKNMYISMAEGRLELSQQYDSNEIYNKLIMGANEEQAIIDKCYEYLGKISYNFGMKPTYEGWTIEQGLDCSGFVEFIYMEAGLETEECLESTLTISLECEEIEHDDLRVGDLGMIEEGGSVYTNSKGEENYTGDFDGDGEIDTDAVLHANHVGIYLGTDENGIDIWANCNAKSGTVEISEYEAFKVYYRVNIKEKQDE